MSSEAWSLAAVETKEGEEAVAIFQDGSTASLEDVVGRLTTTQILRRWGEFRDALRVWVPAERRPPSGRLLAPVRFPHKVICVGANYADHRQEMSTRNEPRASEPFFLLKPPASTIIGPDDEIRIRGDADRVDWEAEVAVVIGVGGRFISHEKALDHIAGYMLGNDVSARGAHERKNPIHAAFAYDWVASKGQDTFCPIGPAIRPAWFIENPGNIPFQLAVNGKLEQSGNTGNLIVCIRDLIVSVSGLITLEPGDVLLTGTPSGVGAASGRFLREGDVVELSSPLLGAFRNTVRTVPVLSGEDQLKEGVPAGG